MHVTLKVKNVSGLMLMNIHYDNPLDYEGATQIFAEQQPWRMLLVGQIVFSCRS